MESKVLRVTMKEYEETFRNFCKEHEQFIVEYTGDDDPETGKSWCLDCLGAKPFIMEIIPEMCSKKGISRFICSVGDKPTFQMSIL
jgi:hypothetical protein